jgi:hypothetical protein
VSITQRLNIWSVGRDGRVRDHASCPQWEISRDALTLEKSTFVPLGGLEVEPQEFLIAKREGSGAVAFVGQVDSLDNGAVVCSDSYGMQSSVEVPVTSGASGVDVCQMLNGYWDVYSSGVTVNGNKQSFINPGSLNIGAPWSYQTTDGGPAIAKLSDLTGYALRRWGTVIDDGNTVLSGGYWRWYPRYQAWPGTEVTLKNSSTDFVDWDVYEQPQTERGANAVWIISKQKVFAGGYNVPNILSTWYVTADNVLTQNPALGVRLPVRIKLELYDTEQTDPPTYQEVASQSLLGNTYSHEISLGLRRDSQLITPDQITIGQRFTLLYNDTAYRTVLTGYRYTESSDTINLHFGFIRSTFQAVLR